MQLSNRLSSTEPQTLGRSSAVDALWLFRGAAVVAAGAVTYFYADGAFPVSKEITDLRNAVNVVAGAAATILGFLVSAGALLYAVANTTLARNLQRTGHFNRLLADLFIAASCFLFALVVGLLALFLSPAKLEVGIRAMVFANVLAYLLLIPVGQKLWLLLSNIAPEKPGRLE